MSQRPKAHYLSFGLLGTGVREKSLLIIMELVYQREIFCQDNKSGSREQENRRTGCRDAEEQEDAKEPEKAKEPV